MEIISLHYAFSHVVLIQQHDNCPIDVMKFARDNAAVDNGIEELFYVCLDDGKNICELVNEKDLVSLIKNWAGSF